MKLLNNKIHLNYKNFIIMFTLIPSILILSLSYFIICTMQIRKTHQDAQARLEKIAANVNLMLNHAQLSASSIATNNSISQILTTDYGDDIKAKIEMHQLLSIYFANYKNDDAEHEEILIYHNNPSIYSSRFTKQITEAESHIRKIFDTIENSENIWMYGDDENELILYTKSVDYGDSPYYVIQYKILMSEIEECIQSVSHESMPYEFVFSSDTDERKLFDKIEYKLINGNYMLCYIPNKIISKIYLVTAMYFILILAMISVTIILFANIFSNSINRRLTGFLSSIESDSENNHCETAVSKVDELYPIYTKFLSLMDKIKEIQQRANQLNSIKTVLELELIQMKINPHLLYNTLAAFRWDTIDMNPRFSHAVEALAGYYRKVLHNGEYTISFREELELINDYITILSFTHQKEYKLITDIPDEILDMYTIKLILQPFVENAVLHGLAKTDSPTIKIRAYTEDDKSIKIEISDNGIGIPKSDIDAINQNSYSKSIYKSYGIRNTKRRINLYYGSNSNIVLKSNQGEGTTVYISLENTNQDKLMEKFEFLKN